LRHEIRYSSVSINQLRGLRAFDRTAVLDQIERVLSIAPMVTSKTTVKRLRQPAPTQFRLRAGTFRVYYNVEDAVVMVIQVLSKEDSITYLGESP
jgi:mRNA interferase RelE/StbE